MSGRKYCAMHKENCTDAECLGLYSEDDPNFKEPYRWTGAWPPPASWFAPDGTKVYRSYADYCDD